MNLAISNIGWLPEQDKAVYSLMRKYKFVGLEIAPTRVFPESPYDKINQAMIWAKEVKEIYGFGVPSMQSIWFGRQEKLFGTKKERDVLIEYTKKAIAFAASINCKNLVFGCPQNRFIPFNANPELGVQFFKTVGDYAALMGTVIGIEANPPIYNTNYINDTLSALELIKAVNSNGFLLNLDVGTMIQNKEDVSQLKGQVYLINHIHISEPGLKPIERRQLHRELQLILTEEGYGGFLSIEMGRTNDISIIEENLSYVSEVFQ